MIKSSNSHSNVFMLISKQTNMTDLEKELKEYFPEKFKQEPPEHFGFSKTAEIYIDQECIKMIGFLADFKLPNAAVEVIVSNSKTLKSGKEVIAYISKNEPNPEFKLLIAAKNDDLIRSILKDPKIYALEDVFAEMKKDKEKGTKEWCYLCPVAYVGKTQVIICAPLVSMQ